MDAGNARSVQWRQCAGQLNREFGGRTLAHCGLLNGQQFAVTPGVLRACGSATHMAGPPAICEYREPDVSPEEFLYGLASVIRENQATDGPCAGCRNLVSVRMPRRFVARCFASISLHDFSGCNSRCVYCAGSEYFLPVDYVASFDYEVLFSNLLSSRLIKSRSTRIDWGGGEPALVETFDKTVALLVANRIAETINTSGIRFSPQVERALQRRLAIVRISVDSGTNDTFAAVKRDPHCDEVWETVTRYAATGGNLVVKYIVFSMNSDIAEVEAFVERCRKAGVKEICISVDTRSVWDQSPNSTKITDKELRAAAALFRLAREGGIGAYFESIWPPGLLKKIGRIGGFNPQPLSRLAARAMRKTKRLIRGTV
jgi:sulfatase maturation enzyme AslB (radical SAM superfamily)